MKGFHFQDLENDEGIDRWVNYLSNSLEFPMDDSNIVDSVTI